MKSRARSQEILHAVRLAMRGFREKHFDEFPSDHLINQLAGCFDHLSPEERFKAIAFVVTEAIPYVPDVTVRELHDALGDFAVDAEFEAWVAGECQEICERHNALQDGTMGEIIPRTVEAGDQQAIKLIEALEARVAR
jgi:hypothetical protein